MKSLLSTFAAFLTAICVPLTAVEAVEPVVTGEYGEKLDEYLTRIEQNGFSGTVLVAQDSESVMVKAYGWADRENKIPASIDTVFDIGSITKQFTAAAIMKLREEGKLAVEDKIGKYFEVVPEDKQAITLHHLLTHSSGLRSSFGRDYEVMTRDMIIEAALTNRLKRPVGERYIYSNTGYSLLAAIVEMVSGMSYEEFLRKNFFDPLGMNATGYILPQWEENQLAVGYYPGNRWGTPTDHLWAEDGPYWNLKGNGGILSTVGDMYLWYQALMNHEALSEESVELMWTPHVPENPEGSSHYGYGWAIFETVRDTRIVAHNGGNGIFFADFRNYVDEGRVIIEMTNVAPIYTDEYHQDFHRVAAGQDVSLPPVISR